MRRSVIWILVVGLLGLGVLCVAPTAFAQGSQDGWADAGAAATPEINAGAAAGALTIVGGALALLGERLRRK